MEQQPSKQSPLSLRNLLPEDEARILPIPLEFENQPIELLTKELTSLNSSHDYRIAYLGPRWPNTLALNRKLAASKPEASSDVSDGSGYRYSFAFEQMSRHSSFMVSHLIIQDNFYRNNEYKTTVYYRAFEGMNPTLGENDGVKFDASFQSGNLDCAIKVNDSEYDLFLRIDSNTRGHTQWFYFTVSNRNRRSLRLNICNMGREKSLYQKVQMLAQQSQGMKPYVMSRNAGAGWIQAGTQIKFEPAKLRYSFLYERVKTRQYYSLSFTLEFQHEDDLVAVAYCIPYTYSQLLKDISEVEGANDGCLQIRSLGRSRMGLQIPVLRITNTNQPDEGKKVVLAVGRIHPGQSNGSIIVWGMIKRLLSRSCSEIRDTTVFIIIPMINPDGVILGNSRTGVLGKDLNREYCSNDVQLNPEISHIKKLVNRIKQTHELYMFLDFHGHSQKKNAFSYGPQYPLSDLRYLKCKILPKLLSMRTDMFRYYSCTFKIPEDKMTTGRSILFFDLKVPYTYTIETSNAFYYNQQSMTTFEFNQKLWLQLGEAIGETLDNYFKYLAEYEQFLKAQRQYRFNKKAMTEAGKRKKKSIEIDQGEFNLRTVQFAKIMQQIRRDDCMSNRPWEVDEDLDSDSADDQEDMEIMRQAELTKLLNEQPKIALERPTVKKQEIIFDKPKGESRISSAVPTNRSVKLTKMLEETMKMQVDLEKEIIEEFLQPTRKRAESSTQPRKRRSSAINPANYLANDRGSMLIGYNTTLPAQPRKKELYQPIEDTSTMFMKHTSWNTEKQLNTERKIEPPHKIMHYQRPIQIGKDVILPESNQRSKTKLGFYGSDWCNKVRRRLAKRQANYASDIKINTDVHTRDLLIRELDRVTQTIERPVSSINYSRLLKVATIAGSSKGLLGTRVKSFSVMGRPGGLLRSQRISSKPAPQRTPPPTDESSDFLQVRKYI